MLCLIIEILNACGPLKAAERKPWEGNTQRDKIDPQDDPWDEWIITFQKGLTTRKWRLIIQTTASRRVRPQPAAYLSTGLPLANLQILDLATLHYWLYLHVYNHLEWHVWVSIEVNYRFPDFGVLLVWFGTVFVS